MHRGIRTSGLCNVHDTMLGHISVAVCVRHVSGIANVTLTPERLLGWVKIVLIGFMSEYPLEEEFTGHACRDVNM
jgi:hypothetical protein